MLLKMFWVYKLLTQFHWALLFLEDCFAARNAEGFLMLKRFKQQKNIYFSRNLMSQACFFRVAFPRSEFLFTSQGSLFIPCQQSNVIRQIQRNSLEGQISIQCFLYSKYLLFFKQILLQQLIGQEMNQQCFTDLMLASSSSEIKGASQKKMVELFNESKNKYAHLLLEQKGPPLSGVSIDIQSFIKAFQNGRYYHCKILKTSKHEKCLLTKKQILKEIQSLFEQKQKSYCCFYYSGHGYSNGDLAIQTVEHPDGDRLTFHEFFDLWKNRKNRYRWGLQVQIDSCYSGQWAIQLKKHYKEITDGHQQIYLFTSSGPNKTSITVKDYGSLLFWRMLKRVLKIEKANESNEQKQICQLFKTQQPMYVRLQFGELYEANLDL